MKHVNSFPKLCHIHRTIGSTWIVCADLPNCLGKAVQHLRAFMLLTNLRLVQRETELMSSCGGKALQPSKGVDKQTNLRGCCDFSGTTIIICQNWHKVLVENCSTYC